MLGKPDKRGTAAVHWYPKGIAGPTDATTAIPAEALKLGYVSEEGLTWNNEGELEKVKAWGGDTVKNSRPEHSSTYTWTLIEAGNAVVLGFVFGEDNVTEDPATGEIHIRHSSDMLPTGGLQFDMKDGNLHRRIWVANAQPNFSGEVSYNDTDVVGYSMQAEALPGADGFKGDEWVRDLTATAPATA
jgi:hypothetical protein